MGDNNSTIKARNINSITINNGSGKDSLQVDAPARGFAIAASIATVIAALIALATFLHAVQQDKLSVQERPGNRPPNDYKNSPSDSPIFVKAIYSKKNNTSAPKPASYTFATLSVNNEANHFDASLSNAIAAILNKKHYLDIHVTNDINSLTVKNRVTGKFTLSGIDSSQRTEFFNIYTYTYSLEIQFRDSRNDVCDLRTYTTVQELRQSKPSAVSKDQAIAEVLAKFAAETNIPFCNK